MINIRPAKSAQGKIELPASPDMTFMAALAAAALEAPIRIRNVPDTDVARDMVGALKNHADAELSGNVLHIRPLADNAAKEQAQLFTLPESLLQYRAIYMFMALGMGKSVSCNNISQKQRDSFIARAKRVGIALQETTVGSDGEFVNDDVDVNDNNVSDNNVNDNNVSDNDVSDNNVDNNVNDNISGNDAGNDNNAVNNNCRNDNIVVLTAANFDGAFAGGAYISEDDCPILLAYLFGARLKFSFTISGYHLSTPLRPLAAAFGATLSVKQNSIDNADPFARRIQLLQGGKRSAAANTQPQISYTIDADFSKNKSGDNHVGNNNICDGNKSGDDHVNNNIGSDNHNINSNVIDIKIPGDDILGAALIVLKCLIPKGDLEISNVPLEPWAAQTLSLVKKMGGKLNVREDDKTAFGTRGAVTVSKSELTGRKTRCAPFYQYAAQLPMMAVASAFAEGKSVFRELAELRDFEPDGLLQLEKCLRPLGIRHGEMPDGIVIEGAKEFDGFDMLEPLPAHVAIAFCVAGLRCVGKTQIADEHIAARWPNFETMLNETCEFRQKAGGK